MLSLKSIELSGFKSFAKKAVLEFKTPITAIVGPNGSGKSNVAEAFRFVLGEQSMKSMRGKRSEDLIWNGSQSAPRSGRAAVRLAFDNRMPTPSVGKSGRLFDLPFDEVTLERVIHRDAVSEYALNGSAARLRDIVELLAQARIGASGHHIISQGEADRILSVNSRERKQMIEDALGLKIFHYKKEEALRKLERTGENIEKAGGLRQEIKPHLKFLVGQVGRLEKARELSALLVESYKECFAREEQYLAKTRDDILREKSPLEKELHDAEARLAEAQHTLEKTEGSDEKSAEIIALESTLAELRAKKDAASRELGRIEGEARALERQKEREEAKAREADAAVVPLAVVSEFVDAIEHDAKQAVLAGILERIAEFRQKLRELAGASASGALAEISASLENLHAHKKEIEHTLGDVARKEEKVSKHYHELQQAIERDRSRSREAERLVFSLSNMAGELRLKLQVMQAREEKLKLEQEEFNREREEARALAGDEALDYQQPVTSNQSLDDEPRSTQEERKRELERMKIRLEEAGAGDSAEILKEYEDVSARDAFLEREIADLEASAASLRELIEDLEETLGREFSEGLKKINTEFGEFFSVMFGGGSASLALVKEQKRKRKDEDADLEAELPSEDEERQAGEEGVEINVSLPRKKIRSLEMLSGGERALTSIALIFAMSQVNPPPFIILDETDAALDEANSRRYGDMIESLSQKTQLILITHNRETMSRAGVLYGVTMGADAVSQLLSVSLEEAVEVAK